LIVLTRISGIIRIVQETGRHVVQAVMLVIATVRSVTAGHSFIYSFIRVIIRVALIVLYLRFIPRNLRVLVIVLVIFIVQTLIDILLWLLLLLRSTIVVAYQIDWVLIVWIQVRMDLRRVVHTVLKGARNVIRVLIAIFSLLIISALIHHHCG